MKPLTTPTRGLDDNGLPITVNPSTGEPTAAPQPKIVAGAITAGALVVVVAFIAGVTPDLLAPLGPWGGPVLGAIVALGGFLGGYIKRP